ncbi:hypothetical protein [Vagococcus fessus]|nr:hypothetical protein [Vagococcus fessus]
MTREKMLIEIANETGRDVDHIVEMYSQHDLVRVEKMYNMICGGKKDV